MVLGGAERSATSVCSFVVQWRRRRVLDKDADLFERLKDADNGEDGDAQAGVPRPRTAGAARPGGAVANRAPDGPRPV
jgi:hypothetical protein